MNKGQYELEKQRREDKYLNDKYNKHVGISGGRKLFAICTADKKAFKTFSQVTAWQKHVERKIVIIVQNILLCILGVDKYIFIRYNKSINSNGGNELLLVAVGFLFFR